MTKLKKEWNKILDDIFALNQKAVKEDDEEIKSKTCYILDIYAED